MRIAVDVDGTLADSHNTFVRRINAQFKERLRELGLSPVRLEDITGWDWGAKIKALGLSPQDCVEITDRIWREEALSIPPTEQGLKEKMKELQSEGHTVDIVTGRKETEPVKKWLEYHQIPYNRFIFETKKESLDYNVYVDDNPGLAESVPPTRTVLLYHRPWNSKVLGTKNVRRVHNFDEVLGEMRSFPSSTRALASAS